MNESEALAVAAVRAIETADRAGGILGEADRAEASRAAAAAVGESAGPERFLVERAHRVLERLSQSHPVMPGALRALAWRPWISAVVLLLAFGVGLLADQVGSAHRINVLAPPVLLLLAWNLLVYLLIATGPFVHWQLPQAVSGAVAGLAAGVQRKRRFRGAPLGAALGVLATDWAGIAAPLYQMRATRLLHSAAALFALGVIAGLYLRGLALEFRASWESTFLDPAMVQSLLAAVLAPGAWLGQLPLPDLARVQAIRAPDSEIAAYWLHLMALTLVALVVVPRTLLALLALWHERRLARALPLPLGEAYFRRLLRGPDAAPKQAVVVPYGYTPSAPAVAGLERLLERLFGGAVAVHACAPLAYGAQATSAMLAPAELPGTRVLVFNMAATPEREVHGAFAAQALEQVGAQEALLAVVDETAFAARAGTDAQRMQQRRAAWRDLLGEVPLTPAFVNLAQADLASADAALDAALNRGRA